MIHMEQNFSTINFLFSSFDKLENVKNCSSEEIFSDNSIKILSNLSKELYKLPEIREYSDVATFAFFCRNSNLLNFKKKYDHVDFRLGRGIAFHIAPSNVPVNFAYSMVVGILSGNINIIRVPSKNFEQVSLIINALKNVLDSNIVPGFDERLFLVNYDKTSNATEFFSELCDVRIIWGGDHTIDLIRKNKIHAKSIDITFSDRYSFAVINAAKIVDDDNIDLIANNFFNDTYLFDQNACSAPRIIIWLGDNETICVAKNLFWNAIEKRISQYEFSSILAIDKISSFFLQSTKGNSIFKISTDNNKLWRIESSTLYKELENYTCAGGYFLEYNAKSIYEISNFVTRKFQTLAYFGIDKKDIANSLKQMKLLGIDRVVPLGKTSEFDLIWDGYDLIYSLSRECSIR